jgi:glyceraldehyde-3-phosphate dehydrogenase (NADP+)
VPARAAAEFERARLTLRASAQEATRLGGEVIDLEVAPAGRGRTGILRRFPVGPVLAITPFNFPLNLVMHKLAPALAAGCPVVLKPAPQAPLAALAVAEIAYAAGAPPGSLSVLPLEPEHFAALVADERTRLLSFTGSAQVGWQLRSRAGRKKVVLELGGNAGVIVDRDADLERAASRVVGGAFSFAGQSCISVQRVFAHADLFADFESRLLAGVAAIRSGDPADPATTLGPMISTEAASRTEAWVREAVAQGAALLCGGRAQGAFFEPTVLRGAPRGAAVCREEVFAPLVVLEGFGDFESALDAVNDSRYGLQAGVFTGSLAHAWQAFEALEVGGVIVNDIPSWRLDPMPYGGVKDSGLGREGVRWAMLEMTEPKLLVVRP